MFFHFNLIEIKERISKILNKITVLIYNSIIDFQSIRNNCKQQYSLLKTSYLQ